MKAESKELREQINSLSTDLGGDIRYLHQEILELQADIATLKEQLTSLRNEIE